MPKIFETWTVLPHGPLEQIDDGILTVAGDIPMPLGNFPRRMTVVRLTEGRVAIFSAIALPDEDMARIEQLGCPAFLIVPNPGHRLDAKAWKQMYPQIQVIAPPGARKAVSEVVPVDWTGDDLDDPDVHFWVVPGTDQMEGALTVQRDSGTTLVCNDIIGHVRHPHGVGAHVMARLFGYGVSEPQVPRTARRHIKDPDALADQLDEWAHTLDLKRIIVSHGEPITEDPAETLSRLAAQLHTERGVGPQIS
jgi:hypothetical protein